MEIRRKLTALTLVAMMLAMGVVASTHTHVHESNDGVASLHLGQCSDSSHDCGHSHSDLDQRSESFPANDDHDDCQICKLLADFNSTALITVQFHFVPLADENFVQPDASIVSIFSRRASVRGPPV